MSHLMTLGELLPDYAFSTEQARATLISGMTIDSRSVQPGFAFLACKGEQVNGADYIDGAVALGAAAILLAADQPEVISSVPVIRLPGFETMLGQLASRFYGSAHDTTKNIGVTGTNGKTSVSHFIAQMANALDSKTAVLGTVGYGFLDALNVATHTTPDVVRVHQLLAELHEQGAVNVAMEVSSHALEQGRVDGVRFEQSVFTNLSRDHLDYHGSMQAYGEAKAKLFERVELQHAVINLDDPFAEALLNHIPEGVAVTGYGMAPSLTASRLSENMICMERYCLTSEGAWGEMSTPKGRLSFKTPLIGRFNLSNLMASVAVLLWRGYSLTALQGVIATLQGVAGRMDVVSDPKGRLVVIDYAHTPDALSKVLQSLREHSRGTLWCVFGCGGDRDKGKRPLMGQAAEKYADRLVVTSDNPRSEQPKMIVADILAGLQKASAAEVCIDRQAAIAFALKHANKGDVVLIAGKGHEDYQEVDGVRHYFNDRYSVEAILEGAA